MGVNFKIKGKNIYLDANIFIYLLEGYIVIPDENPGFSSGMTIVNLPHCFLSSLDKSIEVFWEELPVS